MGSSASHTGRLYPQEMFLVIVLTRSWVDPRTMVRSEGICHWKIQWHHPGIDPGTVRLVAQRINHYTTRGHISFSRRTKSLSHNAGRISRTELGGFESVSLFTVDCYRKPSFLKVSDSGRYKNLGPKENKVLLWILSLRHYHCFEESSQNYEMMIIFIMSVCLSFCPSSARNNSAVTGRIFMNFDIRKFFENLPRKITFY